MGLFGGRDIDTLPWRAPIPGFDADVTLHSQIAARAADAETLAAAVMLDPGAGFQEHRTAIRSSLNAILGEIDALVSELLGD